MTEFAVRPLYNKSLGLIDNESTKVDCQWKQNFYLEA